MPILSYSGIKPTIDSDVFLARRSLIIGDVTLAKHCSVWYQTVIRGDVNKIEVGEYTNIQDNCTVHVADEHPCLVGDYVTVGHGAILHGCTVENNCLIGMGAIILNGAVIGHNSIIGVGSLITEHKIIPPNSVVVGSPGCVIRSVTDKEIQFIHDSAMEYCKLKEQAKNQEDGDYGTNVNTSKT